MEICAQCGREATNKLECCPSCGGKDYGVYNYTESFKSLKDAKSHSTGRWLDFKGRSRRNEFWKTSIINVILIVLLLALSAILAWVMIDPTMKGIEGRGGELIETDIFAFIILAVYVLGVGFYIIKSIIVQASLIVRRLHDVGLRGFYALIAVVPAVVFGAMAVCKLMGSECASSAGFATAYDVMTILAAVTGVAMFVVFVIGSRPGFNKYGTNPKDLIRFSGNKGKKSWVAEEF